MFRRIREAVRVAQPWGLLKGRWYELGRRGGFGNGVVDLIPDECIVPIVGEGRSQERFSTVEVEVVGADGGIEFQEIAAKCAMTCL
jgi:hypothetical protein